MDIPSNYEDIVQYCYEDVCETADPENWHSGDVAIAFRRWVEDQNKVVKDITPTVPKIVTDIDWELLRDQKEELISLNIGDPKLKLDGIINLLDSFQDYAVDVLGVDENLVFNSENDELLDRDERSNKLDTETDEEYFARVNAETIWYMHIEGTSLYENEMMSEEFITSIIENPEHANAIKEKMRLAILDEVTKHPDNFKRDANGHFTYDHTMYDYGYKIEDYCVNQFNAGRTKTIYVCPNCGSQNVEYKTWTNPNTNETNHDHPMEDGDCYCNDCECHDKLIQKEVPLV
jgi:hypothetical protein